VASFYADENFRYPVVEELRKLGHDVLTAKEAGRADQRIADEEVLDDARTMSRILLTLSFFGRLPASASRGGSTKEGSVSTEGSHRICLSYSFGSASVPSPRITHVRVLSSAPP
jgi:hypothetical protein